MALLQKLKEKLGLGGDASERGGAETEVTVEREADEAAAEPESAETETAGTEPDGAETAGAEPDEGTAEPSESEVDEPVAAETDATASTESLVEEEAAAADPTGAAEPAEAAGPESEDTEVAGEDAGSVDSIKGIGPAYADRLGEIGIDTVADLADADPEAVAEGANVGESRASTWIERANEF